VREPPRLISRATVLFGDLVMAVFGAPVAHEDDAERAVRAGLRILEAIAELNERGLRSGACGLGRSRSSVATTHTSIEDVSTIAWGEDSTLPLRRFRCR
jgi:class 3 adenylate cyclase